jgi:hypothetical protein
VTIIVTVRIPPASNNGMHPWINGSVAFAAYCLLVSSISIAFINRRDQLHVHAQEFGTLIIENCRIAGLTPVSSAIPKSQSIPKGLRLKAQGWRFA